MSCLSRYNNSGNGNICAVTDWSQWTPCSEKCGKGMTTRSRRYKHHLGVKMCNLETEQTKVCIGESEDCSHEQQLSDFQVTIQCIKNLAHKFLRN